MRRLQAHLLSSSLLVAIAVLLAACGGSAVEGDSAGEGTASTAPPVTAAPETTSAPTPDPTESPATTTLEDRFGPKQISLSWDCEPLEEGGLRIACGNGSAVDIPLEFQAGNWNAVGTYQTDSYGEVVGISFALNAYNGHCMWNSQSVPALEGPLLDGQAVMTGVLEGTDRCEGLLFVFETTWDQETLDFVVDGEIVAE